jgi:hypothetical protein
MQYALAIFEKYCHHWKLRVNLQKTKVIIFCKRKENNQPIFKLCGENLQIEDSYSYLGVIQKFTILDFIHISIGVLPSSPYVITFGVVVLTPKIFLQN